MTVKGWVLDPKVGGRQAMALSCQGHSLLMTREDGTRQSFDPERLRPVEMQRGTEVYALSGADGFRIGLTEIRDQLVEARLPEFSLGTKGARNKHLTPILLGAAAIGIIGGAFMPF